jgi:hypothetical protein
MTNEDPAEIARKLTKARTVLILALPADGSWGRAPNRAVAKRAWWSMLPSLIDHKHCPEDANEWALTNWGRAVRAILEQANHDQ